MRVFVFLTILILSNSLSARDQLLSQPARAYDKYAGFNSEGSSCRSVLEPTRRHLLNLRQKGHKLALIMTSGSPIKMNPWRIRDDFQGVTYNALGVFRPSGKPVLWAVLLCPRSPLEHGASCLWRGLDRILRGKPVL